MDQKRERWKRIKVEQRLRATRGKNNFDTTKRLNLCAAAPQTSLSLRGGGGSGWAGFLHVPPHPHADGG